MPTYKVDELDAGPLLDRAVALALGIPLDSDGDRLDERENGGAPKVWRPSTVWNDGMPILHEMGIELTDYDKDGGCWAGYPGWREYGPHPLVAGMRAVLKHELDSETVDL